MAYKTILHCIEFSRCKNLLCSASFLAIGVGTALAWTSPVLPKLMTKDSWFPITEEEGSWVSSLLAIGAIAGALPSGTLSDKFGRKKALLALAGPFLLSWGMIIGARAVWLLCVARFIVGTAVGAACVLVPTYISEIAEPSARGTLGAMFQLFLALGIVLAFVVGSLLSYTVFAILCAVIEVLFLVTFFFMPESPSWLIVSFHFFTSIFVSRIFLLSLSFLTKKTSFSWKTN